MITTLTLLATPARAQHDTPARFETGLEERPPQRAGRGERVEFNLEDGDLMDLVRMMTTITGRRFLVTGAARQLTATVASTEPVTRGEAYQAFLAILNANGLTVVERGRYHVITDSQNVHTRPTEVTDDDDPPAGLDQFVTWVHRVRHMPVAEASQILDGLRSTEGRLIPYAPTSTLIVIDTGANIQRMRRILRDVDVAQSNAHTWVEAVNFANAAQLVPTLAAIFETPTPSPIPASRRARPESAAAADPTPTPTAQSASMRIIADERTNSLILIGTEPEYRRVIALLRELDRRDANATAAVHVRRLQHADAANVTTTLQSLLGGSTPGAAAANAPPTVEGLNGRVRVEGHADLNALVVTATPSDYRVVAELIEQLDVAPRQVFLEMVLMELTVDDEDQLGMDMLGGLAGLFGESLLGVLSSTSGAALTQGLTVGLLGPNLPGTSQPSFGLEIQALAANTQANIISTPYVLALDNRPALINVGQNVPLQGSSVPGIPSLLSAAVPGAQDAASQVQALQSMGQGGGRRDTGTIVHVTPHINDRGEIRLEIQAEDSRQGPVASGNLSAAVLNQSIAETELVARDGQTVVIGGLMRDSVEMTQTGIPILSQIPILGALFGRQTQHTVKRNLLFFITPHVIRGPSDLRAIFERRMRERRQFLERHMIFEGDWEPPLDYTRTRGLVAEMLDTLEEVEAEAAALAVPPVPEATHVERPPIDTEDQDAID